MPLQPRPRGAVDGVRPMVSELASEARSAARVVRPTASDGGLVAVRLGRRPRDASLEAPSELAPTERPSRGFLEIARQGIQAHSSLRGPARNYNEKIFVMSSELTRNRVWRLVL